MICGGGSVKCFPLSLYYFLACDRILSMRIPSSTPFLSKLLAVANTSPKTIPHLTPGIDPKFSGILQRLYDPMLTATHARDKFQYTINTLGNYHKDNILGMVSVPDVNKGLQIALTPLARGKNIAPEVVKNVFDLTGSNILQWNARPSNYASLKALSDLGGGVYSRKAPSFLDRLLSLDSKPEWINGFVRKDGIVSEIEKQRLSDALFKSRPLYDQWVANDLAKRQPIYDELINYLRPSVVNSIDKMSSISYSMVDREATMSTLHEQTFMAAIYDELGKFDFDVDTTLDKQAFDAQEIYDTAIGTANEMPGVAREYYDTAIGTAKEIPGAARDLWNNTRNSYNETRDGISRAGNMAAMAGMGALGLGGLAIGGKLWHGRNMRIAAEAALAAQAQGLVLNSDKMVGGAKGFAGQAGDFAKRNWKVGLGGLAGGILLSQLLSRDKNK
jgi:hypothetical protein